MSNRRMNKPVAVYSNNDILSAIKRKKLLMQNNNMRFRKITLSD